MVEHKSIGFPCIFRPLECEYNFLDYLCCLYWCKFFAAAATAAAAASNSYGLKGNDQKQFFCDISLKKIQHKLF